ncbi:MAG: DUF4340 domain-containing protein [Desulfobacterium sp.]|jgi:hypothetical protein|nr:DUF4340 domain-containing protein [Desulfobacterium sp.]
MKKEFLILAAIIAGLSAYLIFHSDERQNYTLPDLAQVNVEAITTLAIEKNGKTVNLYRENDGWTISDRHYPADTVTVKKLLDVVEELRVSALVSQSQDYLRYDLSPEQTIRVTARKGEEILRSFEIGKTAPTNRHTFVKLSGHKGVYHAPGDFRRDFDRDVEGFRSKEVFKFDREALTSLVVEQGDVRRMFFTVQPNDRDMDVETNKDQDQDMDIKSSSWRAEDGNPVDVDKLDSLAADLAYVDCASYTHGDSDNDKDHGTPPLLKIIVTSGSGDRVKTFDLVLHEKTEDNDYRAASSQTIYPFILDAFQGDDLVAGAKAVLGIKAEEPMPDNQ